MTGSAPLSSLAERPLERIPAFPLPRWKEELPSNLLKSVIGFQVCYTCDCGLSGGVAIEFPEWPCSPQHAAMTSSRCSGAVTSTVRAQTPHLTLVSARTLTPGKPWLLCEKWPKSCLRVHFWLSSKHSLCRAMHFVDNNQHLSLSADG